MRCNTISNYQFFFFYVSIENFVTTKYPILTEQLLLTIDYRRSTRSDINMIHHQLKKKKKQIHVDRHKTNVGINSHHYIPNLNFVSCTHFQTILVWCICHSHLLTFFFIFIFFLAFSLLYDVFFCLTPIISIDFSSLVAILALSLIDITILPTLLFLS